MTDKPMKKIFSKCHSRAVATLARVAILIMATAFLAGCGSKLSGTYKVDTSGGMPFEKMEFSGSKVELTDANGGMTEATYAVDGDKVKISVAGMTQIWTMDKDGALNGGGVIGRFVKQ
jgi:hypothetical protein